MNVVYINSVNLKSKNTIYSLSCNSITGAVYVLG
jgi:hypothetical protein